MDHKDIFEYKKYKIIYKEELALHTFLFQLEGKIDFNPGQFVQASLENYGEATFAICSDPEEKNRFDICIRGSGNATDKMIELSPGDYLKIRGPYGNGWPISKLLGKEIILIAGGMGLIPLRPLLFQILKFKKEFKKIYLICGFRSNHHVLFKEELATKEKGVVKKIAIEHPNDNFWGKKALITEEINKISPSKNAVALMCGPEIMVPFCNKVLLEKGLQEENIYISFERRMECGVGLCQHCNIGKYLVCKDGPVFSYDKIKDEIGK